MQKYNKAFLGGAGGGVGAAIAQLIVLWGWVPPEGEMALSIILAGALGLAGPALGPRNQE